MANYDKFGNQDYSSPPERRQQRSEARAETTQETTQQNAQADALFPLDTFLRGQYGFLIEKEFVHGEKGSGVSDDSLIATALQQRRVLLFQANPKITESKSASWGQHSIIGRAEPILAYNNSDSRVFSLSARYWVDSTVSDTLETLKRRVNYIRSFVNPQYGTDGGGVNPPKVYVLFAGDLWSGINVVVESYSFDYPETTPYFTSANTGSTPMIVDVTLSLREVNTDEELLYIVRSFTGRRGG